MTTTSALPPGPPPPGDRLDVSGTRRTPFGRLVAVELRKSADTRAGRWLLVAIVGITAGIMAIFFGVADPADRLVGNFLAIAATPQGFLLPVLGILLVSSEWGQRTAMVTFALEPSRARVMAAKTAAALLFGLAAYVVALLTAVLATLAGGADDGFAGLSATALVLFLLLQLLTVLQGLAYGALLLSTPAAIVVFFVAPIASTIVFNLVPALRDQARWFDLGTAQQPLFEAFGPGGQGLSGEQYAALGTTTVLWILLPFLLGVVRVLRTELK